MSNLPNFMNDLTCPITLELLEDPVSVPCCMKTFSRQALAQYLDNSYNKKCPLCNGSLSNFDVYNVMKNNTIASIIDSMKEQEKEKEKANNSNDNNGQNNKNIWNNKLTQIIDNKGNALPIAELEISITNSQFKVKPSLFVAVVDYSGSMAGNPWKQVESALIHIMSMARYNPSVIVRIIGYSSQASIINFNYKSEEDTNRTIKNMFKSGGTNFQSAFMKIKELLSTYKCDNNDNAVQSRNPKS